MKTELLHSYSSASLAGLSRSPSQGSFNFDNNTRPSTSTQGLADSDSAFEQQDGCFTTLASNIFKKKVLYKRLPILGWLPQYNVGKLIADVIAGITVGLTILPQGLALASVGGLPPQYGLYSGFVGCFVYIFFGSTKEITIGPTAIMAIMTLTYTNGKPPEYAILLCFLTGVVLLGMGLLQLGFIVNFISTPVISGFTSAAALTICSTQVNNLLGLRYSANGFLQVIEGVAENINDVKRDDALVSLGCSIVLIFLMKLQIIFSPLTETRPKLKKAIWLLSTSRSVLVIVVCTAVFGIIGEDPPRVNVVGDLVPGLPPFKFLSHFTGNDSTFDQEMDFTLNYVFQHDLSALIVLPLLALMEHITCAKAFAGDKRIDASQEMISIGLSNILGSLFSSMPISGSFSRTVINHASGAQTPMGGLVTGTLVILALQYLTPYFYFIPKASLAAVIVCAVIFTVDFTIIYPMWKSKKADLIPWAATFLVSLFLGLEFGVLIGFVISVIFLLYYAARPNVRVKRGYTSSGYEFILVDLDRSMVFPAVEYARYVVMKSGNIWAKGKLPVVIDCQHIQFADFTAAQGIRDLFKMYNALGQNLILWQVKPSIVRILTSVMELSDVPFIHCTTEAELEVKLESFVKELESKHEVKIVIDNDYSDDEKRSSSNETIDADDQYSEREL